MSLYAAKIHAYARLSLTMAQEQAIRDISTILTHRAAGVTPEDRLSLIDDVLLALDESGRWPTMSPATASDERGHKRPARPGDRVSIMGGAGG